MKISDHLRGAVRGTAVAAWWHAKPGRDTLDGDQVDKALDETQALIDQVWPDFMSIAVAAAAAATMATINEFTRSGALAVPLDAATIAELLDRLPMEVINTAEIAIEQE